MIGCLRTRVRKQSIIALYFEFETVHKRPILYCFLESKANIYFLKSHKMDVSNREVKNNFVGFADLLTVYVWLRGIF